MLRLGEDSQDHPQPRPRSPGHGAGTSRGVAQGGRVRHFLEQAGDSSLPGAGWATPRADTLSKEVPGDRRSDWSGRKGARCQTRFLSVPARPSYGRAHARLSGARACASPPFGRPPLCRASRSSLGPRARPPAGVRTPGRRCGITVRSGEGGEGRSPERRTLRPASHGSLGHPLRRGLHPVRSRRAWRMDPTSPEAAGGVDSLGLGCGEAGNVLFKTLLGSRFWLSRNAFLTFQSYIQFSLPVVCVGFCHRCCFKISETTHRMGEM